jgi:hypothetical protein
VNIKYRLTVPPTTYATVNRIRTEDTLAALAKAMTTEQATLPKPWYRAEVERVVLITSPLTAGERRVLRKVMALRRMRIYISRHLSRATEAHKALHDTVAELEKHGIGVDAETRATAALVAIQLNGLAAARDHYAETYPALSHYQSVYTPYASCEHQTPTTYATKNCALTGRSCIAPCPREDAFFDELTATL